MLISQDLFLWQLITKTQIKFNKKKSIFGLEKLDNRGNVKKKNLGFPLNLGFQLILKVMATTSPLPPSTSGNVNGKRLLLPTL